MQVWAHWNHSFHMRLTLWAQCPVDLTTWAPWACWREWLQPNGGQVTGILPPESPQGSPAHTGGSALLTAVTFLLTDMAENIYFSGNGPQHLPSWSNRRRKPLFQPTCLPSKNMWVLSCFSSVWLFETPWTIAHQAPLSMGFSRQDYWNGLPFPSPGDLPTRDQTHVSCIGRQVLYL